MAGHSPGLTGYSWTTGAPDHRLSAKLYEVHRGLSFPTNDRFRLSVALTQWGVALNETVLHPMLDCTPSHPWLDGLQLNPVDDFPEGYFVVFNGRQVRIYQMSTPLDEGLVRSYRLERGAESMFIEEIQFKDWKGPLA